MKEPASLTAHNAPKLNGKPADRSDAPFVTFYMEHGISPVSQDISDLGRHFARRAALYRKLGLAPALLRGRSVIEFGPGSGHNSLFTLACEPARYVFVDANTRALEHCAEFVGPYMNGPTAIEAIESFFEDIEPEPVFDVVLAEGCLPFQRRPCDMLTHLARWTAPGGLFVITTASATSYFSETLRRLLRDRLVSPDAPPADQLDILRPVIGPHLDQLTARSRPLDDWILDNIVQPLGDRAFLGSDAAMNALSEDFDFYGACPDFVTDLRWYKAIAEPDDEFLRSAIDQYHSNALNFLDYRLALPTQDAGFGIALEDLCLHVWKEMARLEATGDCPDANFDRVVTAIWSVADMVRGRSDVTHFAICEVIEALRTGAIGDMPHFAAFWGRGQSYLSFVRHADRRRSKIT